MVKNNFILDTPVLFLVFNRLDTTKMVFSEIKKARPCKLFIASDGPREDKPEEEKLVNDIRKYILKNINWKCEVKTLFRKKNLGCKYAVSSAIDWFFENVDLGIILEDDCLPSRDFFGFCQEMLRKYKNEKNIMHISGTNVEGISQVGEDYFFAPCFNVWGWATWKRAWRDYDVNMKEWEKLRFSTRFLKITRSQGFIERLNSWRLYQLTYSGKVNTWDYQWDLCCLARDALCIIPRKNLITNLGFEKGTHTTNYKKSQKTLTRNNLRLPLIQNNNIVTNRNYTRRYSSFFSGDILARKMEKLLNI